VHASAPLAVLGALLAAGAESVPVRAAQRASADLLGCDSAEPLELQPRQPAEAVRGLRFGASPLLGRFDFERHHAARPGPMAYEPLGAGFSRAGDLGFRYGRCRAGPPTSEEGNDARVCVLEHSAGPDRWCRHRAGAGPGAQRWLDDHPRGRAPALTRPGWLRQDLVQVEPTIILLTGLLACVPRVGWPQAEDAPIPLESWDDDWDFPEGRLRIAGQRFALGLGASMSVFEDATARSQYGSRVVDPEITLYRPTRKGLTPELRFVWVGLGRGDSAARYIAPTLGVRYAFVDGLERRRRLVPHASVRLGPYFTRSSMEGSGTVLGANASVGVEVSRRLGLEVRYDRVPRDPGPNLSTWSVTLTVRAPPWDSAEARTKARPVVPPPGRLVDVEGHRLHLVCLGRGSPTVVLEAGVSDAFAVWARVQPALAETTRVCSYDRAGIGYSDPGPLPRTSLTIARELHALLAAAGESAPYVLVGHSFGGVTVRAFASEHPGEVAGLVLVDASHEDQEQRFPAEVRQETDAALRQVKELAARAARGESTPPIVSYMPGPVARRPAWYATLVEEAQAWPASASELRARDRSLRVPLVVVSAGRPAIGRSRETRRETRRLWDEMQEDLSRLSPTGTRIIAHRSGHYVQRQEPRVVIDAVRLVLDAARRQIDGKGTARSTRGAPSTQRR
jgi:pimeloyl-ACP methyl ester carboxylesterase